MGFPLSVYSVWPSIICTAVLVLLAATPLFAPADTPPSDGHKRLVAMDGLRGFLALAVVFHHGAIYHRYLMDGTWMLPPSRFYSSLGPLGVSCFFFITGFLFWGRVARAQGINDWPQFFIGRIFRIGPLYLAAVLAVFFTVLVQTGTSLHVSGFVLVKEIAPWLTLGILRVHDINGYTSTHSLLAGVEWSIVYEWRFYIALPFLALACRRVSHLYFALGSLILLLIAPHLLPVALVPYLGSVQFSLFPMGMVCASLHTQGLTPKIPNWISSLVVIVLLSCFFCFQDPYSPGAELSLALCFYLVVSGCSLFSLLTLRSARRLGDVSYGIYLLQGLVFAAVMRTSISRSFDQRSALDHWILLFTCMVILIFFAMLAHVVVERPGIALGKKINSRYRRSFPKIASDRVAKEAY